MRVQYNVVEPHMRTERGGANRNRARKLQMLIIRTDANQVGVPIRINLYAANEKYVPVPILDAIKTMTRVAVRFRPPHNAPVPPKGRQGQAVEMEDIHTRAQKD